MISFPKRGREEAEGPSIETETCKISDYNID